MKLYLLSCKNIQLHTERILPLLPEQRRLAYDRSRSGLTLGAGLLLSSLLGVHEDADLSMGAYGKPFLTCGTPEFSLSHSGEHVLLGVSDRPIGWASVTSPSAWTWSEAAGRCPKPSGAGYACPGKGSWPPCRSSPGRSAP